MDEIKSETKENPDRLKATNSLEATNWKPDTWGGPRPGSGRPTLGGEGDPTVIVTVLMPLSLKEAATSLGDGNMSRGVRRAIAKAAPGVYFVS